MDANCREVLEPSLGNVGAVGQRLVLTGDEGTVHNLLGKREFAQI